MALYDLSRDVLDLLKQAVETVLYHVLRNLVWHSSRRCSGTFGVDEGESTVVTHFSHHIHGLLEVLLCLSRESHDDIGGQGNIRHRHTELLHQGEVLFLRVFAVHPLQDLTAARLKRKMQMAADLFGVLHGIDEFIGEILRMRSHEADPLKSLDLFHSSQEFRKCDWLFQVLSVGVDVLSQKHDFHDTVSYKTLDLLDNIFRLSASLASAHIRHDAVAAEVVAAEHDVDTRFERILSLDREFLHDLVCSFPYIDHHLLLHEALVEQLRKLEDIVGSEDQVHMAVALLDL